VAQPVAGAVAARVRVRAGELLWEPHPEQFAKSNLAAFMQ